MQGLLPIDTKFVCDVLTKIDVIEVNKRKKASNRCWLFTYEMKLEAGVTRSTWERNHITYVLHASYVSNQAFKTKTET